MRRAWKDACGGLWTRSGDEKLNLTFRGWSFSIFLLLGKIALQIFSNNFYNKIASETSELLAHKCRRRCIDLTLWLRLDNVFSINPLRSTWKFKFDTNNREEFTNTRFDLTTTPLQRLSIRFIASWLTDSVRKQAEDMSCRLKQIQPVCGILFGLLGTKNPSNGHELRPEVEDNFFIYTTQVIGGGNKKS